MHLVEVTIPSGMVSFGNVKPSIAVKDPTDLVEVAAAYLEAVAAYKAAEEGYVAAKRDGIAADKAAEAKVMETLTEPGVNHYDNSDDTLNTAAEALAEGLGGVTVVEDAEAPWNKPPTEAPEKPAWAEEPSFDGFDWDN